MTGPVTIGDLMRDRRLLWVYCRECGRERDLDPSILPLPAGYPVPAVGGVANDVGRTTGTTFKTIGRTVGGAAKDMGHAAGNVGREVGRFVPKAVNTTGTVVSKYYDKAGDVVGHIPLLKSFKPVAKDISKCAASREGKIGGAIGAAAGVVTGGLGTLAFSAGQGGVTGCYGKKAYDAGKRAAGSLKKDWYDIRRSARQTSIR